MSISIIRKESYPGSHKNTLVAIEDTRNHLRNQLGRMLYGFHGGKIYLYFDTGEYATLLYPSSGSSSYKLIVPEKYNAIELTDRLLNEDLGVDIWKITKINDSTPYTCNEYLRYSYWDWDREDVNIDGEYIFENTLGDKEKVSLKFFKEEYTSYTGAVIEKKLRPDHSARIREIRDDISILEVIFNECRKRNIKVN